MPSTPEDLARPVRGDGQNAGLELTSIPADGQTSGVLGSWLAPMRSVFRERYRQSARFREDAALVSELERELDPVLEALFTALSLGAGPPALHEGYALLTLLTRRAALLGATPGVALAIPEAVAEALRASGIAVDAALASELSLVAVEGYSAARDEQLGRELRERAARDQLAVSLAPGCLGVFLAGRHDERDLSPTLERFARELFAGNARACLLDLSRLDLSDEEVARAVGQFCALVATIGVGCFICGAPAALPAQFARWSIAGSSQFVEPFDQARRRALAAAGFALRRRLRWPPALRLLPRRKGDAR